MRRVSSSQETDGGVTGKPNGCGERDASEYCGQDPNRWLADSD
jgi:hypothetical protein